MGSQIFPAGCIDRPQRGVGWKGKVKSLPRPAKAKKPGGLNRRARDART
jgi:hypothetical protein